MGEILFPPLTPIRLSSSGQACAYCDYSVSIPKPTIRPTIPNPALIAPVIHTKLLTHLGRQEGSPFLLMCKTCGKDAVRELVMQPSYISAL